MEPKKNPKADLTRKSNLFFAIGLVVSLLLVIVAFEWKTYDEVVAVDMGVAADNFEELIDIPITEQPPPPPPKIQQPEIIEVPDEEVIEEEIELDIDLEVAEEDVVEEIVFEEAPEEEPVEQIFEVVEQQPTPEGGMDAFYKFIAEELEYPAQAQRMGVEGRVFVQFVVDEQGNVSDVKAVKGIGAGADEEAVRVIKQTKWNPGMQRGRAVKVRMVMPVLFRLSN